MKYPPFRLIPALAAAAVLVLGTFWMAGRADSQQPDVRLPNGKLQRDEVLKAEHEANLKDAGRLVEMAEQLQQEIEKKKAAEEEKKKAEEAKKQAEEEKKQKAEEEKAKQEEEKKKAAEEKKKVEDDEE